jgi:hypothetical protein
MDHNACAVSLSDITMPSQVFSAYYKLYIGDAQGNETLNADNSSAASYETWTWQAPANLPEPAVLSLLLLGAAGALCRKQ